MSNNDQDFGRISIQELIVGGTQGLENTTLYLNGNAEFTEKLTLRAELEVLGEANFTNKINVGENAVFNKHIGIGTNLTDLIYRKLEINNNGLLDGIRIANNDNDGNSTNYVDLLLDNNSNFSIKTNSLKNNLGDGKILIDSSADSEDAIKLLASEGPNQTISLVVNGSTKENSINLQSYLGGIKLNSLGNIDNGIQLKSYAGKIELHNSNNQTSEAINFISNLGGIYMKSIGNISDAIKLHAASSNTYNSQKISLKNDYSSSLESINLKSDSGGILIQSSGNMSDSIKLYANNTSGNNQSISLQVDNGNSSESIKLDSKKGGVLIKSAGNITDAITIKASQGDLQTINIVNNYGISEKSIKLDSKKGGIYIHSEANTKNAIKLHASNNIAGQLGHLQQIILQNDNGIFPESIHLNSLKGGIRLESGRNIGDAINLKSIRGGILLETFPITGVRGRTSGGVLYDEVNSTTLSLINNSVEDNQDMILFQKGNNKSKLIIKSEGTESEAIKLETTNGGIEFDSNNDLVIKNSGIETVNISASKLKVNGEIESDNLNVAYAFINSGKIIKTDITINSGNTLDIQGEILLPNNSISADAIFGGTFSGISIDTSEILESKISESDITINSNNTLDITKGIILLADNQISGDKIEGGTITDVNIEVGINKKIDVSLGILDVSDGELILADNQISGDKIESLNPIKITNGIINKITINDLEVKSGIWNNGLISNSDITIGENLSGGKYFLDITEGDLLLSNNQISGDKIHGGNITNVAIEAGIDKIVDLSEANLILKDKQISGNKIDGGTINDINITQLEVMTGVWNSGVIQESDIYLGVGNIIDTTLGSVIFPDNSISGEKINGGTISNISIENANIKTTKDNIIDLSESTVLFRDKQISANKINGGTIDNVEINNLIFTNFKVSDGNIFDVREANMLISDNQISGDKVEGGTIENISIENLNSNNITFNQGGILDLTSGFLNLADDSISGNKINGGTIDSIGIESLLVNNGLWKKGSILDSDIDLTSSINRKRYLDVSKANLILAENQITSDKIKSISANKIIDGELNVDINSSKKLDISKGNLILADNQISGDKIEGGSIENLKIINLETNQLDVSKGDLLLADNQVSGDKIEGGTITKANIIMNNNNILDVTEAELKLKDNQISGDKIEGGIITKASLILDETNILDVTEAELKLKDNQISGDKIEGGEINTISINNLDSTKIETINLNTTTLNTTNLIIPDDSISGNKIDGGTIDNINIIISNENNIIDLSKANLILKDRQIAPSKIAEGKIQKVEIGELNVTKISSASSGIVIDENGLSLDGKFIVEKSGNTTIKNKLKVGSNGLIFDSGSITDTSGQISFDDENLITTGNISADKFIGDGSELTNIHAISIANNIVTTSKINDNAIISTKIESNAVIPSKISFIDNNISTNDGMILIGNTDKYKSQKLSGDIKLDKNGVVEVVNIDGNVIKEKSINGNSLKDNIIENKHLQFLNNDLSLDEGNMLISDGVIFKSNPITGDITVNKEGFMKIGANKINASNIDFINEFGLLNDGNILISDGNLFQSVSINGDATIDNSGKLIINNNVINTNMIKNDQITTEKINNLSITTEKISNLSITNEKIANQSITFEKIKDESINSEKIVTNSIIGAKLKDNSITGNKIEDNSITIDKVSFLKSSDDKPPATHLLISDGNVFTNYALHGAIVSGERRFDYTKY